MMRKALAVSAVVMLALCAVAVSADDSDATVTERTYSGVYVAEITVRGYEYNYFGGMVFINGSANHLAMQNYLKDPGQAAVPTEDDSDQMGKTNEGKKAYIYDVQSYIYYSYYANGTYKYVSYDGTKVLDPSYISFFVKEGAKFKLTVSDYKSYGGTPSIMHGAFSESLSTSSPYEYEFKTNTIVQITPGYSALAADVTYEASGYALPNGSSTVFIVAAVVIAATILAILVMCGIHPRWAK